MESRTTGTDFAYLEERKYGTLQTTHKGGELSQELPTPAHFAQAAQLVCEDNAADVIVYGPDPAKYIEKI